MYASRIQLLCKNKQVVMQHIKTNEYSKMWKIRRFSVYAKIIFIFIYERKRQFLVKNTMSQMQTSKLVISEKQ